MLLTQSHTPVSQMPRMTITPSLQILLVGKFDFYFWYMFNHYRMIGSSLISISPSFFWITVLADVFSHRSSVTPTVQIFRSGYFFSTTPCRILTLIFLQNDPQRVLPSVHFLLQQLIAWCEGYKNKVTTGWQQANTRLEMLSITSEGHQFPFWHHKNTAWQAKHA